MTTATPVSFVRGGQVAIHFVRMARQVFKWSALVAIIAAIAYWLVRAALSTDFYDWYLAYEMARSDTMLALSGKSEAGYIYHDREGAQVITTIGAFKNDPDFVANYYLLWEYTIAWAWQSLAVGGGAAVASMLGFIFIGSGLDNNNRIRGSMLVSVNELKYFVERKWKKWRKDRNKSPDDEYNYTLAGVRFPPDAPMVHTMMVGTTGSGKTVAINELLAQIRAKGDCAVIYDRMGGFTRYWYDEKRDYILNPFDERDAGWSPFADANSGAAFANMAAALIPKAKGNADPFWNDSAQTVFANIAEKLAEQGDCSIASLRRLLIEDDLATVSDFVQGTPAASLIDEHNEKTALSIRSTLIPQVEFLKHMRGGEDAFSIRQWVQDEPKDGSFLFLSGDVDYENATRNLNSVAIEMAAKATMTLDPIDRPRIWFIIDELPSLNYLPFLGSSLAEIRQFGGCFVVGYQVFSQLRDIYGPDMAETISGTVNNRLIFSVGDHATAERCAKSLGKEDIEEKSEGMSLGANETRDGVTIQERRTERDIVSPSQIMDLPTRFAYLRFGYDAPRAKVEFPYVKYEPRAEKIIKLGTSKKGEAPVVKRQPKPSEMYPDRRPPEEPRNREHMFLTEYFEWLNELVEPDQPFRATAAADAAKLDIPERKAHFLKQRLNGIALEDVRDLEPDYPPDDREAYKLFIDRLDYERACLNAYNDRMRVEETPTDAEPSEAPKEAEEIVDPDTGEVTVAAEPDTGEAAEDANDTDAYPVEDDKADADIEPDQEKSSPRVTETPSTDPASTGRSVAKVDSNRLSAMVE